MPQFVTGQRRAQLSRVFRPGITLHHAFRGASTPVIGVFPNGRGEIAVPVLNDGTQAYSTGRVDPVWGRGCGTVGAAGTNNSATASATSTGGNPLLAAHITYSSGSNSFRQDLPFGDYEYRAAFGNVLATGRVAGYFLDGTATELAADIGSSSIQPWRANVGYALNTYLTSAIDGSIWKLTNNNGAATSGTITGGINQPFGFGVFVDDIGRQFTRQSRKVVGQIDQTCGLGNLGSELNETVAAADWDRKPWTPVTIRRQTVEPGIGSLSFIRSALWGTYTLRVLSIRRVA